MPPRACPALALAALVGSPSLLLAQRTVTISPADPVIIAPTTCQAFSAAAVNQLGKPVPDAAFLWSVSSTEFSADSLSGQVCFRGTAPAAGASQTSVVARLIGTNAQGNTTLTARPGPSPAAVAAQPQPIAPRLPPGAAPGRVQAKAESPVSAVISWSAASGATGYTVARGTAPGGPFNPVTPSALKPDATSFKDVTLTPNTTYYWIVSAQYSNTGQGSSAPVSATTPAPKNPPNFTAKASGFSEIVLSWTRLPEAYYWLQGDGLPARRVDDTTFKLTGLKPGLRNFSVIAYYASGTQTFGDEDNLSKTIGAAIPANWSPWITYPANSSEQSANRAFYYYMYRGAIPHKDTFTKWKLANGFPAQGAAADEVRTRYFNAQDLNLGRDTHCREAKMGLACYQSNSGPAPGNPGFPDPDRALTELVNGVPPFASVAMDRIASGELVFYAYNNTTDSLVLSVTLDTEGPKAMPTPCVSCHGASFLPFDVFGFKFANAPGFTLADQEEAFRKLNLMVRNSAPNAPIVTFIDGMYRGGVSKAGMKATDDWVPQGWLKQAAFYHVVKRTCRTCHLAAARAKWDLTSYDQLSQDGLSYLWHFMCRVKTMPHAEVSYRKFWEQTNPYIPAIWSDPRVLGMPGCT